MLARVPALLLLALVSCSSFDPREESFACDTAADCADGRVCVHDGTDPAVCHEVDEAPCTRFSTTAPGTVQDSDGSRWHVMEAPDDFATSEVEALALCASWQPGTDWTLPNPAQALTLSACPRAADPPGLSGNEAKCFSVGDCSENRPCDCDASAPPWSGGCWVDCSFPDFPCEPLWTDASSCEMLFDPTIGAPTPVTEPGVSARVICYHP